MSCDIYSIIVVHPSMPLSEFCSHFYTAMFLRVHVKMDAGYTIYFDVIRLLLH
jgi:hypothetical protein